MIVAVEKIEPIEPALRHHRIFSERDFDLYEEKVNHEEEWAKLEKQRQKNVGEVFTNGGVQAVLEFVKGVGTPWCLLFAKQSWRTKTFLAEKTLKL